MTRNTHAKLIDLTWLALLGATVLLWTTFEGAGDESNAALLMAIMVVKSSLIGAVFMDLWRGSKGTLALLVGTMIATGVTILWFAT